MVLNWKLLWGFSFPDSTSEGQLLVGQSLLPTILLVASFFMVDLQNPFPWLIRATSLPTILSESSIINCSLTFHVQASGKWEPHNELEQKNWCPTQANSNPWSMTLLQRRHVKFCWLFVGQLFYTVCFCKIVMESCPVSQTELWGQALLPLWTGKQKFAHRAFVINVHWQFGKWRWFLYTLFPPSSAYGMQTDFQWVGLLLTAFLRWSNSDGFSLQFLKLVLFLQVQHLLLLHPWKCWTHF